MWLSYPWVMCSGFLVQSLFDLTWSGQAWQQAWNTNMPLLANIDIVILSLAPFEEDR